MKVATWGNSDSLPLGEGSAVKETEELSFFGADVIGLS